MVEGEDGLSHRSGGLVEIEKQLFSEAGRPGPHDHSQNEGPGQGDDPIRPGSHRPEGAAVVPAEKEPDLGPDLRAGATRKAQTLVPEVLGEDAEEHVDVDQQDDTAPPRMEEPRMIAPVGFSTWSFDIRRSVRISGRASAVNMCLPPVGPARVADRCLP